MKRVPTAITMQDFVIGSEKPVVSEGRRQMTADGLQIMSKYVTLCIPLQSVNGSQILSSKEAKSAEPPR